MTAGQVLVRMDRGARYLTPSGRVCRWVPAVKEVHGGWLTFAYVDGRQDRDDQFNLTVANAQRLLKRVEPVGMRS